MNKKKIVISIGLFFLGIITGGLGTYIYNDITSTPSTIRITGTVIQGTESDPNLYLNSPIYLENATLPDNIIYLKFQDDDMMNMSIGKKAALEGYLQTIDIGDEQVVVELLVTGVQLLEEEGD
ncbi:MAG: hypothetical protein ACP5FK_10010 [bacterium]